MPKHKPNFSKAQKPWANTQTRIRAFDIFPMRLLSISKCLILSSSCFCLGHNSFRSHVGSSLGSSRRCCGALSFAVRTGHGAAALCRDSGIRLQSFCSAPSLGRSLLASQPTESTQTSQASASSGPTSRSIAAVKARKVLRHHSGHTFGQASMAPKSK